MRNTETMRILLESGAFEGEHPEFDPKEYRGVEEAAKKLHKETAAIRPTGDDSVERLSQRKDAPPILDESLAKIHQGRIVEQLRNHTDRIWHMDAFEKEGKYNCLRISLTGIVSLDIIKPGVHKRYVVKLAEHISAEGIQALRAVLKEKAPAWENILPQGFLAEGEKEHNEQSTFDENGGTRPGAIFVADRTLDLGIIENSPLLLRWIVRHTNSKQINGSVEVDDVFRLEYKTVEIDEDN